MCAPPPSLSSPPWRSWCSRVIEWAVEVYVQHCARPRDAARMMP